MVDTVTKKRPCGRFFKFVDGRVKPGHDALMDHEHPVVLPHVSHFMQVPLRTSVKLPHSPHGSPS